LLILFQTHGEITEGKVLIQMQGEIERLLGICCNAKEGRLEIRARPKRKECVENEKSEPTFRKS